MINFYYGSKKSQDKLIPGPGRSGAGGIEMPYNIEHKKEYAKEYYLKNVEKIKAYRFKNRKRENENKERWRLKNLEKIKAYRFRNKEKINIKSKEYYLKNIERVRRTVKKYINTEHGHFLLMWHRVKKHRYGYDFKNFEEFFQHWLDQKAIYGMTCPATNVKMTIKRKKLLNANQDSNSNLVSVDRILNNKGYSKQNVIFTTWAYNKRKGSVTPKDATVFLRIVKERYGTDEMGE